MIEAIHLTRHFGGVVAVDDLNLSVNRGELFCFLGPNGAGKTTTIKMLCGLLRPTAGSVRIAGMDLETDGRAIRQITGYVPDLPFLYDRLTTQEFLTFCGELYRVERGRLGVRTEALIDQFDLGKERDLLIRHLSHGMRQRLVYASALLHEPKVLFVDEPFVGLDPYSIRMITRLLKRKAREGMTVFLTTHILALAEEMADRVGVISQGRLAGVGTVPELIRQGGVAGGLEEAFLSLTGCPLEPDDEDA